MQLYCSEMASKNVIADLNKGEKLDDKNYYLWSKKIQYLLNELDVLKTLTTTMEPPEEGTLHSTVETNKSTMSGSKRIVVRALPC